jgi:hypothetical protein
LACGCASVPLAPDGACVAPESAVAVENPLYVAQGPQAYGLVFEKVLEVVARYFEIAYSNRYDGRIETFPRVSPGLGQPWRPSSPDLYQRLEATLQSMRRRAIVLIQPADDGGYFIEVTVFKELEDIPQPTRALAGVAAFRAQENVERQFEVIDAAVLEPNWVPKGRDTELEQVIVQQLKKCL